MGNYISSKKKIKNNDLTIPILEFEPEFYQNIGIEQIKKYIDVLRNEIIICTQKNDDLEKKVNDMSDIYKSNIYTLNEQINLINKDLKTLLHNDKCLLVKYNSITESDNYRLNKKVSSNNIMDDRDAKFSDVNYINSDFFNSNIKEEDGLTTSLMSEVNDDDINESKFNSDYISYSNTNIFNDIDI